MKIIENLKRFWNTKGELQLKFVFELRDQSKWGTERKELKFPLGEWKGKVFNLGRVSFTAIGRWVSA